LFTSSAKKQLPTETKNKRIIIDEKHVNSGVTMFAENETNIIVYREEEMFKVLLHELIHAYRIDFHDYNKNYDNYLMQKYDLHVRLPHKNMNTPLALYEAYTDTLACYGHLITYCVMKGRSLPRLLKREQQHILSQAKKVWEYCNRQNTKGNFIEGTHVFSYYIAKAAIFENFHPFLALIDKYGVRITPESKDVWLTFLLTCLDNKLFWDKLQDAKPSKILQKMHTLNSLCMTHIKW
jgi:hypothetical protein